MSSDRLLLVLPKRGARVPLRLSLPVLDVPRGGGLLIRCGDVHVVPVPSAQRDLELSCPIHPPSGIVDSIEIRADTRDP